jgi:hypothetical protein
MPASPALHAAGSTRPRRDFVDARDIDPEPLLASENLGDVTFAVLCRDGKRPDVIKKILERIVAAPAAERPDGVAILSVFSDLRHIGPYVQTEMEKMGISVDLEDSNFVRPTIDRARRETTVDLIIRSLRTKFAGQVPADLSGHLEKYRSKSFRKLSTGARRRPPSTTSLRRSLQGLQTRNRSFTLSRRI